MATSSAASTCRRAASRSGAASWPTAAWGSVCAGCEWDGGMTTEQQPNQARAEPPATPASAAPAAAGEGKAASLPQDALIILPVRNVVLYPGIMLPLALG